jgi:hypothetical protein
MYLLFTDKEAALVSFIGVAHFIFISLIIFYYALDYAIDYAITLPQRTQRRT